MIDPSVSISTTRKYRPFTSDSQILDQTISTTSIHHGLVVVESIISAAAVASSSSSPFTMTFGPNTVRTTMRFVDNHKINMISLNLNSITLPAEQ